MVPVPRMWDERRSKTVRGCSRVRKPMLKMRTFWQFWYYGMLEIARTLGRRWKRKSFESYTIRFGKRRSKNVCRRFLIFWLWKELRSGMMQQNLPMEIIPSISRYWPVEIKCKNFKQNLPMKFRRQVLSCYALVETRESLRKSLDKKLALSHVPSVMFGRSNLRVPRSGYCALCIITSE